jgi:hypothetical protein
MDNTNNLVTIGIVILVVILLAYMVTKWYNNDDHYRRNYGIQYSYDTPSYGGYDQQSFPNIQCPDGFTLTQSGRGIYYCLPSDRVGGGACGAWTAAAQAEISALGEMGAVVPDIFTGEGKLEKYIGKGYGLGSLDRYLGN